MRRRVACQSRWWKRTISRQEPRAVPPGSCTAASGTLSSSKSGWYANVCGNARYCCGLRRIWSGRCLCICWQTSRARALYEIGLTGYDLLALGRNVGIHRGVNADQIREAVPGFDGQHGGFRYFECQTDDARLTIEVARTASAFGAVLANHAKADRLLGCARVEGATVTDELTGEHLDIRARVTVNAGGVWADHTGAPGGGSAISVFTDSPLSGANAAM